SECELEQGTTGEILQHVDIFLIAHFFEHLRPYRDAYLAEVCLLEQEHGANGPRNPRNGESRLMPAQYDDSGFAHRHITSHRPCAPLRGH
ncbi:MAG TPA: hypothetical protein VKK81_22815, partial [Candidatus Binatia bacterium]|nr:hypothetical protein [Candidatus Binatia bacterium]